MKEIKQFYEWMVSEERKIADRLRYDKQNDFIAEINHSEFYEVKLELIDRIMNMYKEMFKEELKPYDWDSFGIKDKIMVE